MADFAPPALNRRCAGWAAYLARFGWTKSTDQRAFGLASPKIGARMPVTGLALRLRTVRLLRPGA
jgi:hypothetical protein